MKRILIVVFFLLFAVGTQAQKRGAIKTLSDVDSLVALKYNSYEAKRDALVKEFETEKDSLRRIKISSSYDDLERKCSDEIFGIYTKYVSVPRVTERFYAFRTSVGKDKMRKVYDKLPSEVKASDPYARSLKTHLDTRQVGIGDTVGDFRAKLVRDGNFRFGELSELKDVLLIFGGLDCMGADMLTILKIMYRKVDLSKLEIVSVFDHTDKNSFEQTVRDKGVNWLSICDFKGDHSPIKIAFAVQATPTCVYISKGGCVEQISIGVSDDILALITQNSYK